MTAPISAELDEPWLDRALAETPRDGVPRQTLGSLEGRMVSLTIVGPRRRSQRRWERYSAAGARRASLRGDGLLPLVAAGNGDGRLFVAYQIGEAVPLSAYTDAEGLSHERCLQLAWGLGRALDEAVSQGVLPCEVTPDSLFVEPGGELALAELGIAREALVDPPPTRDRYAPWVAPELLRGRGPNERTAVYSFGALLYTLLSGAPPHAGTRSEIASARPPRLSELRPDLPQALDRVLATAMARDPGRRYALASEARRMAEVLIRRP